MAAVSERPEEGASQAFYCSTSDTHFDTKEQLSDHYKSDFHRYNLKRKVAGLPPVTKDWFDARKDQLSTGVGAGLQKMWTDPLTKKRFNSENTYLSYVNSKKYQELVRQSGQAAPKASISLRRLDASEADQQPPPPQQASASGYRVKPLPRDRIAKSGQNAEELAGEDAWETASDSSDDTHMAGGSQPAENGTDAAADDAAQSVAEDWQPWDPCKSLFDQHVSSSLDENLEYMWRKFRFTIPDAEYLSDPAGLLNYLALKMARGHMPLYIRGDEPRPKQMASMHGVQRHMIDTGLCKMAYDDNEEEYEDFYDYADMDDTADDMQLVESGTHEPQADAAYELAVAGSRDGSQGGKLIGHRDFARFYRQRHRPSDTRASVAANAVVSRYRALGIATAQPGPDAKSKRAQCSIKLLDRLHLNTDLRSNVNRNLPRNVAW